MYLLDYNIHSDFSPDGQDSIDTICQRAIARGIDEIAFTEHLDFELANNGVGSYNHHHALDALAEAQDKYSGDLYIRHGIEVVYQTRHLEMIEEFLDEHHFDFTIAAIHHVGDISIDDRDAIIDFFNGHKLPDAYLPFFLEIKRAVESRVFDLIGHFDYVQKVGVDAFGPFDYPLFENMIDAILKTIIKNEMGLELNTLGLRESPREFYPSRKILKRYHDLGGEIITVGSNAIRADNVGAGIPNALWLLKQLGFQFITTFEQGEPAFIPIDLQ